MWFLKTSGRDEEAKKKLEELEHSKKVEGDCKKAYYEKHEEKSKIVIQLKRDPNFVEFLQQYCQVLRSLSAIQWNLKDDEEEKTLEAAALEEATVLDFMVENDGVSKTYEDIMAEVPKE